jgi:hypothetical protein
MSIRSCTYRSNLTDFLPIRQEFVFFMMGGRKGLRFPGWEIFHVKWSSSFGIQKWKMPFWCDEKESFLLQHCKPSQDAHVCIIRAHYHKLCYDSSNNIGRLA